LPRESAGIESNRAQCLLSFRRFPRSLISNSEFMVAPSFCRASPTADAAQIAEEWPIFSDWKCWQEGQRKGGSPDPRLASTYIFNALRGRFLLKQIRSQYGAKAMQDRSVCA
jgi:hypothetical protein